MRLLLRQQLDMVLRQIAVGTDRSVQIGSRARDDEGQGERGVCIDRERVSGRGRHAKAIRVDGEADAAIRRASVDGAAPQTQNHGLSGVPGDVEPARSRCQPTRSGASVIPRRSAIPTGRRSVLTDIEDVNVRARSAVFFGTVLDDEPGLPSGLN